MQGALFSIDIRAKPFLKWAGGKTQLLEQISTYLPKELISRQITRYVEPFIGGGAVFFYVVQRYPIKESYLFDVNEELILAYKTIQKSPTELISRLQKLQNSYSKLTTVEQEEEFYEVRHKFNHKRRNIDFDHYQPEWIERTAQ